MGCGTVVHYFGAFLLLAATALLVVVDISAPVVDNIALLKVTVGAESDAWINYGTFGWCEIAEGASNDCSPVQVGYDAAEVARSADSGIDIDTHAGNLVKGLTHVMVLHPVATGISFLAFLLCVVPSTVGSLFASFMSILAFVIILVALICDVVALQIIHHEANRSPTAKASWGPGLWLVAVAAICNLIASVLVFVSCCSSRIRRRREQRKMSAYTKG